MEKDLTTLRFQAEILEDPNDPKSAILDLGEDLCERMGWKEGDTLEWINNKDGTWALRKKATEIEENQGMTTKQRINYITRWIKSYATRNKIRTLVVGVSGGIDSAVVSTLCARTGINTIAVSMPIHQSAATHSLSIAHGRWLAEHFDNARHHQVDLTPTFRQFERCFAGGSDLAFANSRSRLRMMCLYQIAQDNVGIVVGTGNRVEDFGVGFFTKYGDGGVDISPIGDCAKTDVWAMGRELGILDEIITAAPTDGLWADARTDEDQLGMTYPELEEAMRLDPLHDDEIEIRSLGKQQRSRLRRYRELRARNMHKMVPIPVCKIPVDQ